MGILDLFREWQKFGNRNFRPRRRTAVVTAEVLEVRRLLTATLTGTTLQVTGSATADAIVITQSGGTTTVTENGTTTYPTSAAMITAINVVGGASDDQITINNLVAGTTLTVDGGGGTNTLISQTQANAWDITGPNSGTLNGNSFSNIQNLTGGGFNDDFAFFPGGFVGGTIDGGGGLNDLDYSNLSAGVIVNLATSKATNIGSGFVNITDFDGSSDTTDMLIGMNISNAWHINGGNSGDINGQFVFTGVENLVGGTADDSFVFGPAGFVAGTIKGGTGNNTLDYSTRTTGIVANLQANGATAIGATFDQIQNIIGTNLGTDLLIANNYNNLWNVNGANAGTVTSPFTSMSFQGIANLMGGTLNDTFKFADGAFVSGTVDGSGGNNTLDYSSRTDAVNVNLGTTIATGINGGFTAIQNIIGNATVNDVLIGANSVNVWNITSRDTGNVNGLLTFSGFENLTGGTSDDTFVIGATGIVSNTVSGGTGNNTLDYSHRTTGIVATLQTNAATAIGGGFNGITNIVGSNFSDELDGSNTASTWSITGANAGTVSNGTTAISFSGIENLRGGSGNDSFQFSTGGSVSGNVSGGSGTNTLDYSGETSGIVLNLQTGTATGIGGTFTAIQSLVGSSTANDSLVGANTTNTWNISGGNTGNVNGSFSFSSIENLTGGNLNDTFRFLPTGFVSGTINGGLGTNTLDFSAVPGGVVVNLQSGLATSIGGGFSSIQNVIGSSAANDLLIGANISNVWHITGGNSGDLNGLLFSGFENLTGGSSSDSFVFGATGFVGGNISGGGGSDTLDYSNRPAGIVTNLQTSKSTAIGGTFSGISLIIDNNSQSNLLIGANINNVWDITGGNSGMVTLPSPSTPISFQGIGNLTGGTLNDSFRFESGGSVSGNVNGVGGINTLDYSPQFAAVTTNLQTSKTTGILGTFASIGNLIGGHSNNDTLIGQNITNNWNITGTNGGVLNGTFTFSGIENLNGGTAVDVFSLLPGGSISGVVNGGPTGATGDWLDYSNYTQLAPLSANLTTGVATGFSHVVNVQNVQGGSGTNSLSGDLQGNVLVGGSSADTISSSGSAGQMTLSVQHGTLTLGPTIGLTISGSGTGSITVSGSLSVLSTALTALSYTPPTGFTGTDRLSLSVVDTTDNLTSAPVNIAILIATSSTAPTITAPASVKVAANGTVAFTTPNAISVADSGGTTEQFSLSVQHGTLTLGSTAGLIVSGNGAGTMTVTGSLSALNSALASLKYAVTPGYLGTDTLNMSDLNTTDDQTSATISVAITTNPNAPFITAPASVSVAQNATLPFTSTNAIGVVVNTNSGPSLLIGGMGSDTLIGGVAQDIVIGGYTNYDSNVILLNSSTNFASYDANLIALNSILAEWQSSNSTPLASSARVNHLRNGGGLNGTNTLVADVTVHNDVVPDKIFGGPGPNWLWGQPAELLDRTPQDIVDTPIDNPPVLSGSSTAIYTLNQAPVAVNPSIVVSDSDSLTLASATVRLTSGYMSNQDSLSFTGSTATGNIVGSFSSNTGTLTLTSAGATATVAQFQAALRLVTYSNSSGVPSVSPRSVQVQVNDGTFASNTIVNTIVINHAPQLAGPSILSYPTGQTTPLVINPGIAVTDSDNTRLAFATVQITTNYVSFMSQDVLSFASGAPGTGDIVGSFNATTGVLTLRAAGSIQDTVAQYQAALQLVTYQNTQQFPFTSPRTVVYQVSDGSALSNTVNSTINFV